MPENWETLCHKYHHERDDRITFYEPTHTYTIDGSSKGIISGTGFLHQFFGHFDAKKTIEKMMRSAKWPANKYYGMTAAQIEKQWSDSGKDASTKGTAMHLAIEQFLNGAEDVILPEIKETIEFQYFMNFWQDHGGDLEPYRAEWSVFSEAHMLCGQIDMLFRRKSDGKFLIYDWKRSREIKTSNDFQKGLAPLDHLDDCNYWQYSLQLNLYRWILENLYSMEIAEMYLIICHPDNKNYRRMRLNRLEDEVVAMLDCRKRALDEKWPHPVKLPVPEPTHTHTHGMVKDSEYGFLDD
jgi:ATP-dependent exoDNAse (exonuclease V) beta subunit